MRKLTPTLAAQLLLGSDLKEAAGIRNASSRDCFPDWQGFNLQICKWILNFCTSSKPVKAVISLWQYGHVVIYRFPWLKSLATRTGSVGENLMCVSGFLPEPRQVTFA